MMYASLPNSFYGYKQHHKTFYTLKRSKWYNVRTAPSFRSWNILALLLSSHRLFSSLTTFTWRVTSFFSTLFSSQWHIYHSHHKHRCTTTIECVLLTNFDNLHDIYGLCACLSLFFLRFFWQTNGKCSALFDIIFSTFISVSQH